MEHQPKRVLLDISWEALLKIVALAAAIWGVFLLRDLFFMLFVVFVFVAAVSPVITTWQRYMSRPLAVILLYAIMFLVLTIISYIFIPLLVRQLNDLAGAVPALVDRFQPTVHSIQSQSNFNTVLNQATSTLAESIRSVSDNLLSTTISFFGGLFTVLTGLVLSFYLLLEEKNAREFLHQILPQNRYEAVYTTVHKISIRLGSWVRGQLLLMLLVGTANFISYSFIHVPSPLPLAIWAGLTEAIPILGPLLGVLAAASVALASGSVLKAVLVAGVSILIIQQLEANVAVPKIMGKVIGLSPVLVILAIVVGAKLLGPLGALIALPAAAIVSVIVGEWPHLRRIWEDQNGESDEAPAQVS